MSDVKKSLATSFGDVAYSEQGAGRPALFVHGVFHNSHLWDPLVERLKPMRRCIALDLMTHGDTRTASDQDVSFAAQAEMLSAFCEGLGLDRVDLVANDSGSGIAQIFAARHPARLASLTLTNGDVHDNWPPANFERTRQSAAAGQLVPALKRMLDDLEFARAAFASGYEHPERLTLERFRESLGPLLASEQRAHDLLRFFAAMNNRDTVAVEPLLRTLQAPTLIVWGTADIFFDVKWAYWLKDTIPGCRKVVELDGAKLFFPEERPDALADAIRAHWEA
ncbi:MAG: alpha/beta hydrolase [Alphaproteobacteria bacterium]|nr:alpha/beta hydrolase [Alphaproteobacteria bacterium]